IVRWTGPHSHPGGRMAVELTLYAPQEGAFPVEKVRELAEGAKVTRRGRTCRVEDPEVTVTFNVMPDDDVGDHLLQFQCFLNRIAGAMGERLQPVLARVQEVQQVIGVVIEPDHDAAGKVGRLIEGLAAHLEAMLQNGVMLYDEQMRLLA